MKSSKVKQNGKEEPRKAQKNKKGSKSTLPLKSTPPNTLNASSPPLDRHLSWIGTYHVFLSTTLLANSSTNFVPILSPFDNELIKHKLREE
jgi:hypothetical protein